MALDRLEAESEHPRSQSSWPLLTPKRTFQTREHVLTLGELRYPKTSIEVKS